MSTKPKSGLSETPIAKLSPATPRVSKSSRGIPKSDADSPSPLHNSRLSVDRSPRSIPSKPTTVERRSPKLNTTPDKKPTRILKPSELQAELNVAQEDLKKAKEKLVLVEKEKEKVLEELKQAQRLAEEGNEKLREALAAQKRAEESSEIEKFRAVELEQAGIEEAQKKEDEWEKELETVRNQHALDVAALLSATQELQKAKQELAMMCDAKNQALGHAEDATKIAEAHAERVETLSAELIRLKSMLDSKVEMEMSETNKFISDLKLEIDYLRQELDKAKAFEEQLFEKETVLEQLNVDLEAAKMAESYARNLVDELHEKIDELSSHAEQAKRLERSASESLESVNKQLEVSNESLHDAESEIGALKEKTGLLEISIGKQKGELEETERLFELAKGEASEMAKQVESLSSELETVKEEKKQSLNNEKVLAANVQTLLEEKNQLINELGTLRDEDEKSKKALESLASALHEVSSEARDAKEKLGSIQVENESYETQIEDLKLVIEVTKEKYGSQLGDAKQEINALTNSVEQSKLDYQNLKDEWGQKELQLINSVQKFEEENSFMDSEVRRLVNLLKMQEEETSATRGEEDRWKKSYKEAESEVVYLNEVLGEAKAESMKLKEGLMERENEMEKILEENEELRRREAASQKKIEELSKLLEDLAKKQVEKENSDTEKDYDMLPKVVEFSEQNGTTDMKPTVELQHDVSNDGPDEKAFEDEKTNEKVKQEEKEKANGDSAEVVDLKMWESCKIEEKDLSAEREGEGEQESLEDEVESKADRSVDNNEQENGVSRTERGGSTSPSKQKKKKALLGKFGSLLKKKRSPNHQK